ESVRGAKAGGGGGDGLTQRFGLLVWPDEPADWKDVDEWPNAESLDAVWRIFERISKLSEAEVLKLGALKGPYDKVPFFRFDEEASAGVLDLRRGRRRGPP